MTKRPEGAVAHMPGCRLDAVPMSEIGFSGMVQMAEHLLAEPPLRHCP